MNDELDILRAKRLEEMQAKKQEQVEFGQRFAQLEALVKPYMTQEALYRYGNLRVAHAQLCIQAMLHLAKMIQSKKVSQVDDKAFKLVLMRLQEGKKEIKVNYR